MNMKKCPLVLLLLILPYCTSTIVEGERTLLDFPRSDHGDGFNDSMSDQEVLAYNNGKPIPDQIECRLEAKSSKVIRKRICKNIQEWSELDGTESSSIRFRTIFNGRGRISDSTVISQ
ncbi:MAG: hypothetical protein ACJZ8M_08955 [Pseudohongiellaceae bacterium]